MQRESVPEQSAASTSTASSVLRLDFRKLKAEDELRKIFGSKVINENSREEDEGRLRAMHSICESKHPSPNSRAINKSNRIRV